MPRSAKGFTPHRKSVQGFTPFSSHERGFTLVELLVVISIIAILSAVGLVIYSGVQKQGRIAKRIGDLKAIQTALELYHTANNAYPSTGSLGAWRSECNSWNLGGSITADKVVWESDTGNKKLVPTYMPAFPQDPSMDRDNSQNCYLYASNGTDYKFLDMRVTELTAIDIANQRNLVDSVRTGGNCSTTWPDRVWAIYSNNTGANDTSNPACW